jgi:hypothetical protein
MTLTRRTTYRVVALVALAAITAFDAAQANHYILPCEPECFGPGWSLTGSLNTARTMHTATQLRDGRVLVTGGIINDKGEATASTELYDPATATWSYTGALSQPRYGHTATLLADGRVLVVGTARPFQSDTAEIYDPATAMWTSTGRLTAPHAFHTATLLQNGKVLIAGGWDLVPAPGRHTTIATPESEIYDPLTDTWSRTGDLNLARFAHTATLLQDGEVLIAGGADDEERGTFFDTAELYDPETGIWTSTGSLKLGRNSHTATLLPNGEVLVAAGWPTTSSELYDPAVAQWKESGTLDNNRFSNLYSHTATLLASGDVLLVGGAASIYAGSIPQSGAENYDADSGTWVATSSIATRRFNHTATLLRDGTLLVVGGDDGNGALATAELYSATAPVSGEPASTGSFFDPRRK